MRSLGRQQQQQQPMAASRLREILVDHQLLSLGRLWRPQGRPCSDRLKSLPQEPSLTCSGS